jgi:hypothetical protein
MVLKERDKEGYKVREVEEEQEQEEEEEEE